MTPEETRLANALMQMDWAVRDAFEALPAFRAQEDGPHTHGVPSWSRGLTDETVAVLDDLFAKHKALCAAINAAEAHVRTGPIRRV